MRIKKENSIGLIIDIQSRLFPHIFENEKVALNGVKLIEGLNVLGVEQIVTEQYRKGLGETIPEIQKLYPEFKYMEKSTFSCCGDKNISAALKEAGKEFVIIAGIESHVCVLQTVLDLLDDGYTPVLVEDCVSSRNYNDKKFAVSRMRKEGAIITTYESVLFELLEVSGTEQFKAISKIVK